MDATLPEVLGDKLLIQVRCILRDYGWSHIFISIMKESNDNIQTYPCLQENSQHIYGTYGIYGIYGNINLLLVCMSYFSQLDYICATVKLWWLDQ